jgi:large subunit ribosomal protein L9
MEVILLEKIRNLGNIGDQVKVKNGYGRNYLIPQGKVITATKANIEKYSKLRAELEQKAAALLHDAEIRVKALENVKVTIPAKASEEGKLFGSIGVSTIANALQEIGYKVKKSEINLPQGPIRQVGEYDITLLLHTDLTTTIKVNVIAQE